MHQQNVKLYGGPWHGKTMAVLRSQSRLELFGPRKPTFDYGMQWLHWESINLERDYTTYWIREYQEKRYCPMRSRSVCVGVLEGAELTPREERELAHDIRQIPWEFPPVSFIDQFDEWMAQIMYRVCGYLEWKGRRVYE